MTTVPESWRTCLAPNLSCVLDTFVLHSVKGHVFVEMGVQSKGGMACC